MKLTSIHDRSLPTGALGLAITPDASTAYASCTDGHVYAVDIATGNTQTFEGKHASFAGGCVLLPDGDTLISGGHDGTLLWHDVDTLRCWRRVQAHQFWNWQLALSPDGTRLATVTGQYLAGSWKYEPAPETEPCVKIFDTKTGDLVTSFSHVPSVQSCAFTPDGRHVAAANIMGEVRVWAVSSAPGSKPVSQWTSPDFTSWGSIKTHHYCSGIFGLAFSPDGESLLCCGMGPMTDPMAGNGKMTWQRFDWRKGERTAQIKDGQHGSGLMESLAWHPDGAHFLMAGRQAQGTWNAALFAAGDGNLVHSIDSKIRITHARFSADGNTLITSGATGQGQRKAGVWQPWGKVLAYKVEA